MIADGRIPPTIAIMPDAPWSSRASYYVDSAYRGADPGRQVETAFTTDLIKHVDSTYRTIASRDGRVIGGYSMGGYGAMRYSIAHPDLFAASIVLSPAVYFPTPPSDSSTREFGAFGQGRSLFSVADYLKLNYPAELPRFSAKNLPSHMFIAVGDDEYQNPNPTDYTHDLDFESHILYKWAEHTPHLSSELRVLNGGHDWDVWAPGVRGGRAVRLPVRRAARGDDHEGEARRDAGRGSRGRRRDRRRGQRLRSALGRRVGRRAAERGRQGRRADQVRPGRQQALDEASSAPPVSTGRTACSSTRRDIR